MDYREARDYMMSHNNHMMWCEGQHSPLSTYSNSSSSGESGDFHEMQNAQGYNDYRTAEEDWEYSHHQDIEDGDSLSPLYPSLMSMDIQDNWSQIEEEEDPMVRDVVRQVLEEMTPSQHDEEDPWSPDHSSRASSPSTAESEEP